MYLDFWSDRSCLRIIQAFSSEISLINIRIIRSFDKYMVKGVRGGCRTRCVIGVRIHAAISQEIKIQLTFCR